ncbi:hypothetical protein D3C81_1780760 [compost metagenome]
MLLGLAQCQINLLGHCAKAARQVRLGQPFRVDPAQDMAQDLGAFGLRQFRKYLCRYRGLCRDTQFGANDGFPKPARLSWRQAPLRKAFAPSSREVQRAGGTGCGGRHIVRCAGGDTQRDAAFHEGRPVT